MRTGRVMLGMPWTNDRAWRRAPALLNLCLVWSAVLCRFSGTVVHSFLTPLATTTTAASRREFVATNECARSSNIRVVPGRSPSPPQGIVHSRIFQLNLATKDDDASSSTSLSAVPTARDDLLRRVVDLARHLGPVGVYQSQEEQDELQRLAELLKPHSDPAPARIPLSGTFDLLYSASPYVSSGRLWGPVHGRVTQEFTSPHDFCNRVDVGPVRLSLDVTCQPKSDTVVQVNFVETRVSLFGTTLVTAPAQGGGEWKYIFAGTLEDDETDDPSAAEPRRKRFIRVLEAPNLFVIEQVLPSEL